ncbi:glycerophosphoryl diester phosphodiesterase membrane domain-containing protein [Kumtagia ephedrae]|uniref:Glycerophosphoryl diester phosphodiesterase membrane domain-containing protein n=1 Tax=Kumtagia ephedrae TaxID=2116701 RepID=A0A2P7RJC5_9HYPH|nr:glycerophosphoryl diester phosphodiesterase membrane domain-containing protein [Mesorhizobium ephedrae]PSJ50322.1 hypothetical protein C7I84_28600 [Mesorhizobium ephedrae]
MSMASYDRPAAFRIGRVFGDTFNVLGRNLGLCIGLAAIFSGLPTFLYQLWTGNQVEAALVSAETGTPSPPEFGASFILAGLVGFIIYMVLTSILQAALVRTTIEDLNGEKPTFADSLSRALAVLLPIIGLSLLMYLGITIGFMLLIIPGLYLLVRWSAAVPVLVHERLGVLASMKRSAELTKGSRWRIFGLFVILILAIWVLQMALGLLALAIMPLLGTVLATAVGALLSAVASVIASIAVAVAYVELRYVKEGADVKQLAEIFA